MRSESSSPATEDTGLLEREDLHHSKFFHKSLGDDVPLYAHPRQRQRWDDQQILPHVNWGDLFFDLFYVAAAYNLAVILKESPSWEGFVYFTSCYVVIVSQWNEKVIYDARFAPEDNIFHRSMEILYLLVLGTAIQHIRPVELMKYTFANSTTFVFSLSLVVMNVIHIKRSEDIQRNVEGGEEAKHHAVHDINRKVCSLVPFLLAVGISGYDYFIGGKGEDNAEIANDIPILLCLGGFTCEQVYMVMDVYVFIPSGEKHFKEIRVPVNIDFTLHRLGEWVMLMLGESVLSLLVVEESAGRRYYVTFYAGIVFVTMMQYLFFRTQPFDADDHAMRRDRGAGYLFFYFMISYSASLIIIGCSFKSILHHYLDEEIVANGGSIPEDEPQYPLEETAKRIADMFSWSMSASFFFLDMMILTHRGWKANRDCLFDNGQINWPATIIVLLDISLCIITATFSQWITDLELLSICGCCVALSQVLMRTRGLRFFPVSKSDMENSKPWPNITEPQSIPKT